MRTARSLTIIGGACWGVPARGGPGRGGGACLVGTYLWVPTWGCLPGVPARGGSCLPREGGGLPREGVPAWGGCLGVCLSGGGIM